MVDVLSIAPLWAMVLCVNDSFRTSGSQLLIIIMTVKKLVQRLQTFAEYCNWHFMYLSFDAQYNFHVHTMEIRDNLHFCLPPKK